MKILKKKLENFLLNRLKIDKSRNMQVYLPKIFDKT